QSARACLAVDRLAGNGAQRLLRQREIDRLHLEQPLVLLHQCVLGLGENELEGRLVEVLEGGHDGQSTDEFRDQAIFQRSSGWASRKISPVPRSSGAITLALKPIEADRPRAEMIFSSPLKAPPHTNRMLVVSTCRNSCCGCLRPPCGGTDAIVPSMILSK